WTWADSAYPMETWCVVPFKKPKGRPFTWDQNICVHIEHAFVALKGWFQSLCELQMKMKKGIQVSLYWIMCCLILHNMIMHLRSS
ncbi:hypothetical protein HYDPIDRAFT_97407, partial [Hydnomerulius pinastri MD-312]